MNTIKILGGGISGLTAAINLKKSNFEVEVHERKAYCGKHTNDFQFLENWTFNQDVLDIIKKINIKPDFYTKPWYTQEILSPSFKKYIGTSSKPLMYLVKRGVGKNSIDNSLEKQASRAGVKILYNSNLEASQADIIATGVKEPTFVATGIIFPFKHNDRSVVLLDDNLSYKMYSYLIINDEIGEIVCINPFGIKDHKNRLDSTVKKFEEILNIKIINVRERFSATGNLGNLYNAKLGKQYFTGEAAGFQDSLAGFGMIYAFKSGYFAAKSITEDVDYNKLWKEAFLKPMKISARNRFLYKKLSNKGYEKMLNMLISQNNIIKKLRGGNDFRQILKKFYNTSIFYFILPLIYFSGRRT
jgi:flavin-dependent dehydrogenase